MAGRTLFCFFLFMFVTVFGLEEVKEYHNEERDLNLLEHLVKAIEYELEDLKQQTKHMTLKSNNVNKEETYRSSIPESESELSSNNSTDHTFNISGGDIFTNVTSNFTKDDLNGLNLNLTFEYHPDLFSNIIGNISNDDENEANSTEDETRDMSGEDSDAGSLTTEQTTSNFEENSRKEINVKTSIDVGEKDENEAENKQDGNVHISFDIQNSDAPNDHESRVFHSEAKTNETEKNVEEREYNETENGEVEIQSTELSRELDMEEDQKVVEDVYNMEMKMFALEKAADELKREIQKVDRELKKGEVKWPWNKGSDVSRRFKWPLKKPNN